MQKLQAIVFAAGRSTRFHTGRTKLLEKICGQEMILYPLKILEQLGIATTMVIGYQKEELKKIITNTCGKTISFIEQGKQRGTGDALKCTQNTWEKEYILMMNGDIPLVTPHIIEKLYKKHRQTNATISFVIAHNADPSLNSYGRIVKSETGIEIIEPSDFTGDTHEQCCVNAGIYIVRKDFLQASIDEIEKNHNAQEFYVTDLVNIASQNNKTITTVSAPFDRIRGVNTHQELWAVEQIQRADLIKYWMEKGVRFSVAQNVHIDLDVTIGAGTYIGCGVHLLNGTVIGKHCAILEFASLSNVILGNHVTIKSFCILKNTHIKNGAEIGPFAHIQENTIINEKAIIGNFVEVKRSTIGANTKAKHLAYIGDAIIGDNVNIGAGTITCNHNGFSKQQTIIKDDAYVGSNTTLIAPITIDKGAFTAAGSVITHYVPEQALAIGRTRQINKKNYAPKLRSKYQQLVENQEKDNMSFSGAIKSGADQSTQIR